MNKIFLPALAAVTITASPTLGQDTPQALQDAFVASINAEDADAVGALYTQNAYSYGPDGSVSHGPKAIADGWAAFFVAFDGFSITLEQQGEMHKGKIAGAWGLWTMSAMPVGGGDEVVWRGRYTDISKKTGDGWRYVADHASPVAADEPSESAGE